MACVGRRPCLRKPVNRRLFALSVDGVARRAPTHAVDRRVAVQRRSLNGPIGCSAKRYLPSGLRRVVIGDCRSARSRVVINVQSRSSLQREDARVLFIFRDG